MRVLITLTALILATASLLASPAAASGCDRYAAPGGSDGAAGTAAEPFRTPQRLAEALRPGDTGCLRSGTYRGSGPDGYVLWMLHGGRRGRPVTIRSAPGQRALLQGIVMLRPTADHVTLQHLDFNARRQFKPLEGEVGISVMAAHTRLLHNRITNEHALTCLLLGSNSDQGDSSDTLVRGNFFYDCGSPSNGQLDHAIYAAESRDARIVGNTIVGTAAYGVHLYPNAQRNLVKNNLLYGNGGGVIIAGDSRHTSNGNVVTGNVIAQSRRSPEVVAWYESEVGRDNVVRDNCIVPGLDAYSYERRGMRLQSNEVTGLADCVSADRWSQLQTALDLLR